MFAKKLEPPLCQNVWTTVSEYDDDVCGSVSTRVSGRKLRGNRPLESLHTRVKAALSHQCTSEFFRLCVQTSEFSLQEREKKNAARAPCMASSAESTAPFSLCSGPFSKQSFVSLSSFSRFQNRVPLGLSPKRSGQFQNVPEFSHFSTKRFHTAKFGLKFWSPKTRFSIFF